MKVKEFFKNAFNDMKESAKQQHEVDKANFNAVKAKSKANFEEAKMSPAKRNEKMKQDREKQIEEANERQRVAEERLKELKENK